MPHCSQNEVRTLLALIYVSGDSVGLCGGRVAGAILLRGFQKVMSVVISWLHMILYCSDRIGSIIDNVTRRANLKVRPT
jgi:hypothetical protein